jgi:hypothetical protein
MSTAAANLPDLAQLKGEQQREWHRHEVLALIRRARELVLVRQAAGIESADAMQDFHANYTAIVQAL